MTNDFERAADIEANTPIRAPDKPAMPPNDLPDEVLSEIERLASEARNAVAEWKVTGEAQ